MTDAIPTADIGNQATIAGTVGQRPDGKFVCILVFSTDHNSYQQAMPPEAADKLGDTLGPMLKDLAAQARRAQSGLLVATSVPTRPDGGNKK